MVEWMYVGVWIFLIELIGISILPVVVYICSNLRDRGYSISKFFGILVLTQISYILTKTGLVPYGYWSILLSLILITLVSIALLVNKKTSREILPVFRSKEFMKDVISSELIYLILFISFLFVIMYTGDMDHGEARMDFAFINSIIRSPTIPPQYIWFPDESLGKYYYYFGHLMIATLTIFTKIPSSITYNLSICFFLAMMGLISFSIGHTLTKSRLWALLTIWFVVFSSNMLGMLHVINTFNPGIDLQIVGYEPVTTGTLSHGLLTGGGYNLMWWATRVIPWGITEFPYFNLLWCDLHANFVSFTLILLFIALIINIFKSYETGFKIFGKTRTEKIFRILSIATVLGFMFPQFIWNYPIFAAFVITTVFIQQYNNSREANIKFMKFLRNSIIISFVIIALSLILYFPAIWELLSPKRGEWLKPEELKTSLYHFLVLFIFPLLLFFLYFVKKMYNTVLTLQTRGRPVLKLMYGLLVFIYLSGIVVVTLDFFNHPDDFNSKISVSLTPVSLLFDFQLLIILLPIIAASIILLIKRDGLDKNQQITVIMIMFGAFIALGCELVNIYWRNIFMFKLYTSLWIFWTVSASVIMFNLRDHMKNLRNPINSLYVLTLVFLIISYSLYVVIASISCTRNFTLDYEGSGRSEPTLDGTDYIRLIHPADYAAIQWINENMEGVHVILEAPGRSYTYTSRVSVNTGLPTVLGWEHHVETHLAIPWPKLKKTRFRDVEDIYNTTNNSKALGLIKEYGVEYIYVGELEHKYEGIMVGTQEERKEYMGLDKFTKYPGYYTLVYNKTDVQIYRVNLSNIKITPPPKEIIKPGKPIIVHINETAYFMLNLSHLANTHHTLPLHGCKDSSGFACLWPPKNEDMLVYQGIPFTFITEGNDILQAGGCLGPESFNVSINGYVSRVYWIMNNGWAIDKDVSVTLHYVDNDTETSILAKLSSILDSIMTDDYEYPYLYNPTSARHDSQILVNDGELDGVPVIRCDKGDVNTLYVYYVPIDSSRVLGSIEIDTNTEKSGGVMLIPAVTVKPASSTDRFYINP